MQFGKMQRKPDCDAGPDWLGGAVCGAERWLADRLAEDDADMSGWLVV